METICLFASDYETALQAHQAMKDMLDLPDYYGMNADALHDCLGERKVCPALWIRLDGNEEVNRALSVCRRVFEDLDGAVVEL